MNPGHFFKPNVDAGFNRRPLHNAKIAYKNYAQLNCVTPNIEYSMLHKIMLNIFFYIASVFSGMGFLLSCLLLRNVNFGLLVLAAVLWLCGSLVEFMRETRQKLKNIEGLIIMFERDRKREDITD